jgi:hypothetical protein
MAPSVPGDATLQLYARTGVDGAPATTPSQSIPLGPGIAGLAMSDHVVAVDHHNALANLRSVDLYELDTITDAWSLGSTVPRGYDPTRLIDLDVTDTQLVIGESGAPGGSVDGTVVVVPISLAGPGITWSFGSVTAVGPDPSWTSTDRLGFGRRVAVEGDALAVSGGSDHVRFYTWGGTSYAVATTLVNPDAPSLNGTFGESISVDSSTGQARALVGIKGDFSIFSPDPPTPGRVELWVRTGAAWNLEATIPARPAALFGGYATGHEAALDGRWAVVGLHFVQVPAAGGTGTVDEYRLEIYDLQSGPPTFVREISPVALTGGVVPDQVQLAPVGVDVVGSHIVFDVWNSISSSPTRFSAFSVDRHPAT